MTNVYIIETLARQQMIRNAEAARRHAARSVPPTPRPRPRVHLPARVLRHAFPRFA